MRTPHNAIAGTVVIVEDAEQLGASAHRRLTSWGTSTVRLTAPDEDELRRYLRDDIAAVVVLSRDDIVALRYALLVEHLRPGIRLIVTIFDHTTGRAVRDAVPNCTVLSMPDTIVPSLLGACLGPGLAGILRIGDRLHAFTDDARLHPLRQLPRPATTARRSRLRAWFGSLTVSSRALVASFAGLLAVFGAEAVLGHFVLGEHWPEAVWNSARLLTTVGSSTVAEHGPAWYKVVSAALMLLVLALVGIFTASLVSRVTGRRLTAIVGRRSIPGRDHVIVVGLGQVGLRLCKELRRLGVPVVAVERDRDARCLPLAKQARIPVVLGRGGDRFLLDRLNVDDARALAAVSSDGLENLAVAVAARATAPDRNIVLRAEGDEVTAESQSLFAIGAVCDVASIVGATLACHAVGMKPVGVFHASGCTYAVLAADSVVDLETWRWLRSPDETVVAADVGVSDGG
jgi:Trk K+ transport system NAD-binding subunit